MIASDSLLPYGPLLARTVHLCIDMQVLFSGDTPWRTPWMERVLPQVEQLSAARAEQTVFTRFVPPARADEMPGSWRRYYAKWRGMTREKLDPTLLQLHPALAKLCPPALTLDKMRYSAFSNTKLAPLLVARGVENLVISGGETDVCVLATVLDAVDLGYRVIIATDALCSSADETHDALLTLYRSRFSQQIETADVDSILSCWLT